MSYLSFQLKKVFKNKLTPVCLALLVTLMVIALVMNNRTAPNYSLQAGAKDEIEYFQKEINRQKKLLGRYRAKPELYDDTKAAITDNEKVVRRDQRVLDAANRADWATAYRIMWQQKKVEQHYVAQDKAEADPQLSLEIDKKLKFFDYLRHRPLAYESQDMPITGLQFLMQLNQQYLPYVLLWLLYFF